MRWRNDDERALVLEAAAEYGKRCMTAMSAINAGSEEGDNYTLHIDIAGFEEWLRWYFAEDQHVRSVAAYMSGGNHKPSAYSIPDTAASPTTVEVQAHLAAGTTPPSTSPPAATLAWGGLLEKLAEKRTGGEGLPMPQYKAAIRAYEKNVGELPKGTPLARALESITGDYVKGEILKAVNSA